VLVAGLSILASLAACATQQTATLSRSVNQTEMAWAQGDGRNTVTVWRDNQDESGTTIKMRRSGRMEDDCRWPRALQAD